MRDLVLVAHNLRSTHNVGSLLRTAEGLGVAKVFLSGYTPYPLSVNDSRLPHIAQKLDHQIQKTALNAQKNVAWEHIDNVVTLLNRLREEGYELAALEQATKAIRLPDYQPTSHVALIVGREVEGIEQDILHLVDKVIEIPMFGAKESFNVVVAAAMGLYHCRFLAP